MSKPKGTMHKPGKFTPESGQYGVVGPQGGKTGAEITVPKGETLLADMSNVGFYRLLYPEGNEANLFRLFPYSLFVRYINRSV